MTDLIGTISGMRPIDPLGTIVQRNTSERPGVTLLYLRSPERGYLPTLWRA